MTKFEAFQSLKVIAMDKLNVSKIIKFVFEKVENIV